VIGLGARFRPGSPGSGWRRSKGHCARVRSLPPRQLQRSRTAPGDLGGAAWHTPASRRPRPRAGWWRQCRRCRKPCACWRILAAAATRVGARRQPCSALYAWGDSLASAERRTRRRIASEQADCHRSAMPAAAVGSHGWRTPWRRGGSGAVPPARGGTQRLIRPRPAPVCAGHGPCSSVNDRNRLALAWRAVGFHLGQGDLPRPSAGGLLRPRTPDPGQATTPWSSPGRVADGLRYVGVAGAWHATKRS